MSSTSWAIWSAVEAKIASMLKAPISLDKAIVKNKSLKGSKTVKTRKALFCVGQLGRSGILKVSTARGRNRWTWQTPTFEQTPLALCLDNNLLKQFFQTFYTIITALKILDLAMTLPVEILLCV